MACVWTLRARWDVTCTPDWPLLCYACVPRVCGWGVCAPHPYVCIPCVRVSHPDPHSNRTNRRAVLASCFSVEPTRTSATTTARQPSRYRRGPPQGVCLGLRGSNSVGLGDCARVRWGRSGQQWLAHRALSLPGREEGPRMLGPGENRCGPDLPGTGRVRGVVPAPDLIWVMFPSPFSGPVWFLAPG